MQKWKNVYVFISSTFNDMHAERDYLVKDVFPELKQWCAKRSLNLIDVDLRWGITKEDSQENKRVVELCLKNIDKCRPIFLCLLGQRRGWVPTLEDINENTIKEFPALLKLAGQLSITELEIKHALKSIKDNTTKSRCLFFIRNNKYLKDIKYEPTKKIYLSNNEENNKKQKKLINKLLLQKHFKYDCTWDNNLKTMQLGTDDKINIGRLTNFKVKNKPLKDVIINEIKNIINTEFNNKEQKETNKFLFMNSNNYINRDKELSNIIKFINSKEGGIFPIKAQEGLGKTGLMVNLLKQINNNLIYCFTSDTDNSIYTINDFKEYLLEKLNDLEGDINYSRPYDKYEEFREIMLNSLAPRLSSLKNTTIIIDGIDDLLGCDYSWLALTSSSKVVITYRIGTAVSKTLDELFKRNNIETYTISPLDNDEKKEIINSYLSLYLKNIDNDTINQLVNLKGSYNPLYLKIILNELRVFGSYDNLIDKVNENYGYKVETAFKCVINRVIEDSNYYGISNSEYTISLLSLISSSINGLTKEEIKEILSLDNYENMNYILKQLEDYTSLYSDRYNFIKSLKYSITINYYEEALNSYKLLGTYYYNKVVNHDNISPLYYKHVIYYLLKANMTSEVINLLINPRYIYERIKLKDISNLFMEYSKVDDSLVKTVYAILLTNKNLIEKNPSSIESILVCNMNYYNKTSNANAYITNIINNNFTTLFINKTQTNKLTKYIYDEFNILLFSPIRFHTYSDTLVIIDEISGIVLYDLKKRKILLNMLENDTCQTINESYIIDNILLHITDRHVYRYNLLTNVLMDSTIVNNQNKSKTIIEPITSYKSNEYEVFSTSREVFIKKDKDVITLPSNGNPTLLTVINNYLIICKYRKVTIWKMDEIIKNTKVLSKYTSSRLYSNSYSSKYIISFFNEREFILSKDNETLEMKFSLYNNEYNPINFYYNDEVIFIEYLIEDEYKYECISLTKDINPYTEAYEGNKNSIIKLSCNKDYITMLTKEDDGYYFIVVYKDDYRQYMYELENEININNNKDLHDSIYLPLFINNSLIYFYDYKLYEMTKSNKLIEYDNNSFNVHAINHMFVYNNNIYTISYIDEAISVYSYQSKKLIKQIKYTKRDYPLNYIVNNDKLFIQFLDNKVSIYNLINNEYVSTYYSSHLINGIKVIDDELLILNEYGEIEVINIKYKPNV